MERWFQKLWELKTERGDLDLQQTKHEEAKMVLQSHLELLDCTIHWKHDKNKNKSMLSGKKPNNYPKNLFYPCNGAPPPQPPKHPEVAPISTFPKVVGQNP